VAQSYDVAVIGGGIVGASAACFLAEAGASVVLYERHQLAAGASGRNSGVVQHPLDALPAALHRETVAIYRELAAQDREFRLPPEPAGLLILSQDEDDARRAAREMEARGSVAARFVAPEELRRLEPELAPGLAACRLETGYPVAPAAATQAFARRARRAGARLVTQRAARPLVEQGRLTGVRLDSAERVACKQVLVAAGPWTTGLLDAWQGRVPPPISALWGVVVSVRLARPPTHVLEELGIGDLATSEPAESTLFSLVSAEGSSGVGSVFAASEPDPAALAPLLLERGARFLSALAGARIQGVRSCARPLSFDGRPLIGRVTGREGLYVCTGHGAWGISTGPASARLVARLMLEGQCAELEAMPELDAVRVSA
jgi:glycine/D-amino acid oxidase-like deaminating enzyme